MVLDKAAPPVAGLRHKARAFLLDTSGNMSYVAVAVSLVMMIFGGVAIDAMHAELRRTKIQNQLDRAVLAAAKTESNVAAETTVLSYFDAIGLSSTLRGIETDVESNTRRVRATGSESIETLFLELIGEDTLDVGGLAEAQEAVARQEISLVLDISGSMRFGNKMDDLRPAAVSFVQTVLEGSDQATINLVPYAGQVNPSQAVFDYLGGVAPAPANPDSPEAVAAAEAFVAGTPSSCLEIAVSDFATANLPAQGSLMTPHFMNWTIAADVMDWGWCPQEHNAIIYASDDLAALTNRLNTMRMHDGTGTHYGMRWGLSLLSPEAQPLFSHLASQGVVANDKSSLPLSWNNEASDKYLVLMTDGAITDQYRPSDFYDPENATVELGSRSGDRQSMTRRSENLTSFYAQCDLAKANNVTVYTIAFQASSSGRTEMRNCASSEAHFFNVEDSTIDEAFASIARSMMALQLTQ